MKNRQMDMFCREILSINGDVFSLWGRYNPHIELVQRFLLSRPYVKVEFFPFNYFGFLHGDVSRVHI